MSECRELEALLAPYVDGEAQPGDCAAIDAHLRACVVCRNQVAAERTVRDAFAMERERLRVCASADLRRRCQASCQPATTSRLSVLSRRSWVPLSMAATLVLAIAGVFLFGLRGGGEALAAQLALDHVKCFEFAPQPRIIPDAAALGREWAAARGWPIKVPESTSVEQLELLGLRRCISTEGITAHLMYKWRGQPLSVYVLNTAHARVGPIPQVVQKLGQEAIVWTKAGRTYAVVARGAQSEIEQVAQYVRTTAE
jgi:anti-sigma factor RsiW